MKIGIDARVLQEGNGGIFVYAKNLLARLLPMARGHEIKLFANQYTKTRSEHLAEFAQQPHVALHQYRFPNKFLNASFRFKSWPRIDELIGGSDVLFFPSMMYSAWSTDTRTVLTMHDLSYEFFPQHFTLKQRIWHKLMNPQKLCNRADKIIAVSHSTKNDILTRYRVPEQKIATIHSGIDSRFRPIVDRSTLIEVRKKYHLPDMQYILQTGTLNPRKNYNSTLAAFEHWVSRYPAESKGVCLLFVGHKGWKYGPLMRLVRKSEFSDRIQIIHDAPAQDLPALYSLASVFVYPSFYEGFGFPVLEAFACGIPVITSFTSSLGELSGHAALLVNPYKTDELVFAIREIMNKSTVAKDLRAKGLRRTIDFGWEKSATETLKVLEHAYRN